MKNKPLTPEELDEIEREMSSGFMPIPPEVLVNPDFKIVSESMMRGKSRRGLKIPKHPPALCPDLLNYIPPINKK